MARARIGHTHLTHSYLLKNEPMPECVPCFSDLTIKHFLVDCVDYTHIRERHYNVTDIKELFENVNATTILNFIKETGLFY